MYRDFYQLKHAPFPLTPDPACLFLSPSHRQALAAITYGVEARQGLVLITGVAGVGKTLILRVPERGEILGLAATISGQPYQASAEVLEPAQANFIARNDFLEFLKTHGEAALRVAQELSENYHLAIAEMRTIGLSHSAAEKFARFLFEQIAGGEKVDGEVRATLTLTHEEIAQMIGSSRETVTRLFSDFKKKQILQVKGSTVIVRDLAALRKLAEG